MSWPYASQTLLFLAKTFLQTIFLDERSNCVDLFIIPSNNNKLQFLNGFAK